MRTLAELAKECTQNHSGAGAAEGDMVDTVVHAGAVEVGPDARKLDRPISVYCLSEMPVQCCG